jgi:hypothetical protein
MGAYAPIRHHRLAALHVFVQQPVVDDLGVVDDGAQYDAVGGAARWPALRYAGRTTGQVLDRLTQNAELKAARERYARSLSVACERTSSVPSTRFT